MFQCVKSSEWVNKASFISQMASLGVLIDKS